MAPVSRKDHQQNCLLGVVQRCVNVMAWGLNLESAIGGIKLWMHERGGIHNRIRQKLAIDFC